MTCVVVQRPKTPHRAGIEAPSPHLKKETVKTPKGNGPVVRKPTFESWRRSMTSTDIIMARQIESTGNIVSGLGEHGLANQLWALAHRLRERAKNTQEWTAWGSNPEPSG